MMKRMSLILLLLLSAGAGAAARQMPGIWSAELTGAIGYGRGPKMVAGVQGSYYFFATDRFRVGAGAGVSMSKPMHEVLADGEYWYGYTEWAIPVYLRGEFHVPAQTKARLVLRADTGYRIGVATVYNQKNQGTLSSPKHFLSGFYLEPQAGVSIRGRNAQAKNELLISVGWLLQHAFYTQTTRTEIIAPDQEGAFVSRGDVHDLVPGIAFHVEFRF